MTPLTRALAVLLALSVVLAGFVGGHAAYGLFVDRESVGVTASATGFHGKSAANAGGPADAFDVALDLSAGVDTDAEQTYRGKTLAWEVVGASGDSLDLRITYEGKGPLTFGLKAGEVAAVLGTSDVSLTLDGAPLGHVVTTDGGETWLVFTVADFSAHTLGVAPAATPEPVVGNGTDGADPVGNGTAANGTAENGTADNGTDANGTATTDPVPGNDTAPGTVDDGTTANGTTTGDDAANGTVADDGTVEPTANTTAGDTTADDSTVGNSTVDDAATDDTATSGTGTGGTAPAGNETATTDPSANGTVDTSTGGTDTAGDAATPDSSGPSLATPPAARVGAAL